MRSSMSALKEPDSSDALTMLIYRGLKTLGCFWRASEKLLPLSTSFLICMRISRNLGFSVCSAMPSMATRMEMPALIMTASWLVKLETSLRPGPLETEKLRRLARLLLALEASMGARARM